MILITGGTGIIGGQLVTKLIAMNKKIRIFALPGEKVADELKSSDIEVRFGNIVNAEDLNGVCNGVSIVIHLAAVIVSHDPAIYTKVNIGGTASLLKDAFKAGVKHFIYISSASVVYSMTTPYSLSKRECERLVMKSGIPWTIIRPTLVYSKSGGQELAMFMAYLDKFPIIPFIGDGSALKRPVFSGDIVDGITKVALQPHAAMKIYNFSGLESISMLNFSRLCLLITKKNHKKIVHLPLWFCVLLSLIFKRILKNPPLTLSVIAGITQDADLDPTEAIKEIGFSPSHLYTKFPHCFTGERDR
jgi:nucleoside-diphosphate-sugar epimerase